MNYKFKEHAFGRSFNVNLSQRQIDALINVINGGSVAQTDLSVGGLYRRGLVDYLYINEVHRCVATKAGLLIYDLIVEAGEAEELKENVRNARDMEWAMYKAQEQKKMGVSLIKLKAREENKL